MVRCQYCNKELPTRNGCSNHEIRCDKNPEKRIYKNESKCKYCGRLSDTKHGNSFHETRCLSNSERDKSHNKHASCLHCKRVVLAKQLKNHYLSKSCLDLTIYVPKIKNKDKCIHCGKIPKLSIEDHLNICRGIKRPLEWSNERRLSHSNAMKKAVAKNPDSYTKNNVCGRVKMIEYNGVMLKGSWEVITAKWLDSFNIKWESEVNPQFYFWNGGDHLYFPDFYLPDHNVYIEVKGHKTDRDEAKWSQFKGTLVIIDNTNIKKLIDLNLEQCIIKHTYKGPIAQRPSAPPS